MSDNRPCHRTIWAARSAWEQQALIRINRAIKETTGAENQKLALRLKFELGEIINGLEEQDMPPIEYGVCHEI